MKVLLKCKPSAQFLIELKTPLYVMQCGGTGGQGGGGKGGQLPPKNYEGGAAPQIYQALRRARSWQVLIG